MSNFENMQKFITNHPEARVVTFKSSSESPDGFLCNVHIREFDLKVDEVQEFGGTNKGPNPMELVLAALATCQEITYKMYADKLGVKIEGLKVEVTGELDLRGLLSLDPGIRPGYLKIHHEVHFTTSENKEIIEELIRLVENHCPVSDVLKNPTPIEFKHKINGVPLQD